MNPHQRCLQAKVENWNEPKQVMPKFIDLKGLSQITPGPRRVSKNGYIGHFRTLPDRLPSDFTGAGTISTTRTGAGVSQTLLPILPPFYSNR